MKKILILLVTLLVAMNFPSCKLYRDQIDELYSEVDSLKQSDAALRLRIEQMNSSLTDLQKLVFAMQNGVYITSVVQLSGEEAGYLITLSNGENLTVRDGRDGKDGTTPAIGVKRGDDGACYWTVNGEFLTDEDGKPVRADGAIPLFDIRDNCWYISLDGGVHWENLGPANGSDGLPGAPGDQLFRQVDYTPGENIVTFILSDGTSITLPCYQPISISFTVPDNQTSIKDGETVKVEYTLSYGDENTVVTASSDGNYIVNVEKRDNTSGSILITCPGLYRDGHVNVMAFDGIGYASVSVITFYEKMMSFRNGLTYWAPTEGMTIEIPLSFNFDYSLQTEGDADSWINILRTRAEPQDGLIQLAIAKNDGEPRTGKILVYPDNSVSGAYAVITIEQEGAFFEIGKSSLIFKSAGGEGTVPIRTSMTLSAETPSDVSSWIRTDLASTGTDQFQVKVTVSENGTGAKRHASIPVLNTLTHRKMASIEVLQLAGNDPDEIDLVLEVRPSESNDFTVYLPVKGSDSENEFIVDWGDGLYDQINASSPDADQPVSHRYAGIETTGQTYRVSLSGSLSKLCSDDIPAGMRSGIVSVVQWGNTGLTDMYHAFNGNTSLTTLPADKTLAFGEVGSFQGAFQDCPKLVSISPQLFDSAVKATDFGWVFNHCESLQLIPGHLFSPCIAAVSFSNAFSECEHLLSLPEGLFSGCINAENFSMAFTHCIHLAQVPEDCFEGCSKVTDFSWLFRECRELESIPARLFSDCPEVTSFAQSFLDCDRLLAIPQTLFYSNAKVQSFNCCFDSCDALTAVPEHLFDNCSLASDITGLFYSCRNLKVLPVNLFDNLRKITLFDDCFRYCFSWAGESPYTVVNGRKIHFYERADYPDYFVTPNYHRNSFDGCNQLSDWDSIPTDWKEW